VYAYRFPDLAESLRREMPVERSSAWTFSPVSVWAWYTRSSERLTSFARLSSRLHRSSEKVAGSSVIDALEMQEHALDTTARLTLGTWPGAFQLDRKRVTLISAVERSVLPDAVVLIDRVASKWGGTRSDRVRPGRGGPLPYIHASAP